MISRSFRFFLFVFLIHIICCTSFAQSTPGPSIPSGSPPLQFKRYVNGKLEIAIFFFVGSAALGFVGYKLQSAVRGKGAYHVNQFRVYFHVTDLQVTPSLLAKSLERNFDAVFLTNSVATTTRPYPLSPQIVRFKVILARAKPFNWFLKEERKDDVEISCPLTGSAVFQAKTLAINESSLADWHFLAGLRSWHVRDANDSREHGEAVPLIENTFFLETAALERFSGSVYQYLLIGRGLIRRTWFDFLYAALENLDVKVEPVACDKSRKLLTYRFGGSVWKTKHHRLRNRSGPKLQIWWRECSYTDRTIPLLETDNYAPRLFSLHPGIHTEYRIAVPETWESGSPKP